MLGYLPYIINYVYYISMCTDYFFSSYTQSVSISISVQGYLGYVGHEWLGRKMGKEIKCEANVHQWRIG